MLPWQLLVLWIVVIVFFYLIFVWFFNMGRLKALFLSTFVSALVTFAMIQMTDQAAFSSGEKTWIAIIQWVLFLVPIIIALWLIFRHCRRHHKKCDKEEEKEEREASMSPRRSVRSPSPVRSTTSARRV